MSIFLLDVLGICSGDCGCLRINDTIYLSTNYTDAFEAATGTQIDILGTVDVSGVSISTTSGLRLIGVPTVNATTPVLVTGTTSIDGDEVYVANLTIQGAGLQMATASPGNVTLDTVTFNCTTGTTASSGHVTDTLIIRDTVVYGACVVGYEFVVEGESYIDRNDVDTTGLGLNLTSPLKAIRSNTFTGGGLLNMAGTTVADVFENDWGTVGVTIDNLANDGLTIEQNTGGGPIVLSGSEAGIENLIHAQFHDHTYLDDLRHYRRLINSNPAMASVNGTLGDCVGVDCPALYSGRDEECDYLLEILPTADGYHHTCRANFVATDSLTCDFDTQERGIVSVLSVGSLATRHAEDANYPEGDNGWTLDAPSTYEGVFTAAQKEEATNRDGDPIVTAADGGFGGYVCVTRLTNDSVTEEQTCVACERYDILEDGSLYALATSAREGDVRVRSISAGEVEYSTCTQRVATDLYGNATELTDPVVSSEDCPGDVEVEEGTGEVECDGEGQVFVVTGDLDDCTVTISHSVRVNSVVRGTGHTVTLKADAPATPAEEDATDLDLVLILLLSLLGSVAFVAVGAAIIGMNGSARRGTYANVGSSMEEVMTVRRR